VTSQEDGVYSFEKIIPGKYTIKASHSTFTFAHDSLAIEVLPSGETTVIDATPSIVLSGYDVRGKVLVSAGGNSKSDLPMGNVALYLSVSDKCTVVIQKEKICPQQNQVDAIPQSLNLDKSLVLCVTKSDDNGEFTFIGIPISKHKCELIVTPYYEGFRIDPTNAKVVVTGPTQLKTIFKVKGFALSGRVLDENGKPIENVIVKIKHGEKNEETVVTQKTDSSGVFSLEDQIGQGMYSISVEKYPGARKLWFSELNNVKVEPQTRTFPDITVTHYELCGSLQITNNKFDLAQKRKVHLESPIFTTSAEAVNGKFCFKVPVTLKNTKLTVRVELSDSEKSKGLQFSDWHKDITDIASIGEIVVAQELLSLSGKVNCLDKTCDTSVTVGISRKSGEPYSTSVSIDESGAFKFDNLLTGVYTVEAKKESWCWEVSSVEHTLSSAKNVLQRNLKQGGFKLSVVNNSPFAVTLNIFQNKQKQKNVDLKIGSNEICLPAVGAYELQPVGCLRFQQETFDYNTNRRDQLIQLQPQSYLLKGRIDVSGKFDGDDNISISVGNQEVQAQKSGNSAFEYSYWAPLSVSGQSITVVPKSNVYLFTPESHTQKLPKFQSLSSCLSPIPAFKATRGEFVTGKVFNEKGEGIAGVTVTVKHADSVVAEILSKEDGAYEVGPLRGDLTYQKQAKKTGYSFMEKQNSNDFQAVQLSSITVSVKAADEELAGVFISLSSHNFRNNTVTNGETLTSFSHLYPGNFFLTPMLKEYTFDPATLPIQLGEGEKKHVTVKAKRVAFSCYGTVQSLNGEPESSVIVEAYGSEGQYEETVSDEEGRYRIRGLKPGVSYKVSVKIGTQQTEQQQQSSSDETSFAYIERASPVSTLVTVQNSDYNEEVNFVVFRTQPLVIISGHVNISSSSSEIESKLEDLIRKANIELLVGPNLNRAKVEQSQSLTVTRYFQFIVPVDLSQKNLQYFVRLVAFDEQDKKMYKSDARMQYVTGIKSILKREGANTGVQTGTTTRLGTYYTRIDWKIEHAASADRR
jgi:protocatechuate 3,4-dioxygenase beta subunit